MTTIRTKTSASPSPIGHDDDYDSIVLNVFFSKDSDAVYIRGWNLLTASAGTNYVLSTLNQLNHQYKYVKFTFDESDNTVYVQMDGYLSPDHPGDVAYRMMNAILGVLDADDCRQALKSLI